MTNGTTNPLLTKTESTAAASFFSVLSSTVGLPAPVVGANDSRSAEPDDSNAASPQQDQPTKTSQANPGAQQQNITLPSPFSGVAGTNLTVLPAARFRAFLSTTSATVPSTISARQNQKDSAEPAPVLKNTSAVTVPTTPVPADVVAAPVKKTAKTLAASVQAASGATAVEAKPATSAAVAIDSLPTSSTTSIENATPALPVQRSMLPGGSETAIPQPSTDAPDPASATGPSFVAPVDVQSTPLGSADPQQVEDPQATIARPAQNVTTLAGNCQQPNAGSTDSASTNTTPAPSATTPNTVRNSDQHIVPFVFAQGAAQLLKPATPAAPDAAPTSNGDSTKQTPAADAVTTVQPPGSDSAQTSTLKAALASAAQYPAVKLLPDLNAGNATTVAVGTSGNGNQIKGSDSGNEKNPSDGSTTSKISSSQNGTPTPSAQSGGTTQHAQLDAAQISAMTAKVADASPLQTAPVHVAAQQQPIISGATDRQPHSAEIAGSTLPAAADGPETAGTSGVNTAKLIQTLSETQMQVGMHSAEFGDISIRTAVSEQQMVAQITVDHGDLGRAIALHAPAAQIKLGDDLGVRAAIQVTQSGMSFSHEHGSAAQQEQRSFARPVEALDPVSPAETESTIPRAALAASETDRLDIRA
jgi:hypothetical protein